MTDSSRHDAWQAGDRYEAYMGRWSRQMAPLFIDWLAVGDGLDWLDVGCGTGALSAAIVARRSPRSVIAIDPSKDLVVAVRQAVPDARIEARTGDAQALPVDNASRDVIVSALVLNFVPDKPKALGEMRRVARPGAAIGFYVWDYPAGGVEFMQAFWDAAIALDPAAREFAEDRRFPFCTPDALRGLASDAGLSEVDCTSLEVPTVFVDFHDYWHPFTLGAGPAPGYCVNLAVEARERLRQKLDDELPRGADGTISLKARAWAVKAIAA